MNRVLVTGSSKGIGAKIAEVLSSSGYQIFLHGRDENALKNLFEKIGVKGFFSIDLTEENAAQKLFDKATEVLGGVDILINNAGEYFYAKVEETPKETLDRLVTINTKVPYELISLATVGMKEKNFGRIINIGSISGAVGEANASLYSMTKSAFSGLTKALALELAQNNITVNTINPGYVKTALLDGTFDDDFSEKELLDMIPQNRFIEPVEIANLVKYLVSAEARGLTGQCINLCAGMSVGG
ncbi:MAG: SDR family oxidoreductase [bacterium]|nr:SDR family oxidoreductase [bacterium]